VEPVLPAEVNYSALTAEGLLREQGTRVWVEDLTGLLGLLDMDVIELHRWNSTVDDLEHPDVLVFHLRFKNGLPLAAAQPARKLPNTARDRLRNSAPIQSVAYPVLAGLKCFLDGREISTAPCSHEHRCGCERLSNSGRPVRCMRPLRPRGSKAGHTGKAVPLP
jgi:hypothetical protein